MFKTRLVGTKVLVPSNVRYTGYRYFACYEEVKKKPNAYIRISWFFIRQYQTYPCGDPAHNEMTGQHADNITRLRTFVGI